MIEKAMNQPVQGEIEVSAQVLEVIAGIATQEVTGVYAATKSFSEDFLKHFANHEYRRGIELSVEDNEFIIDIYVNIYYGVPVPDLARRIQQHVREQVYYMTEIELKEVNVHFAKIIPETLKLDDIVDDEELYD